MASDNEQQMGMPVSEMRGNDKDIELRNHQEDSEELITPVVRSAVSSYFSSVSSARKLLSRHVLSVTHSEMTGNIDSKNVPSLTKVSETISLPDITDWTISGSLGSTINDIETVRNSTASFLTSSNETVSMTTSSWLPEEIGAVIIVSIMVPIILVSNMIVIISIVRFRRLHTPTNYFISSLAAVDIFVALVTPLGVVVEVFNFGGVVRPEDVVLCLLPNRILMMACGVSVLTLATIAYDRQTALVFPLNYVSIMTPKKVAIMVALTWLYAGVIVWMPLMAGWYDPPSEVSPCSANLIHGIAPVLFLSAIFVPSCIVIFVCYFRIFMVARHHVKAIAAVEFAVQRSLQVKFMIKDTKYAKTLAMVIGAFLVLWLPYLIFIFVQTVCSKKFNIWIQTYLILLTVLNSGINPWVYAFKNNELRAAFKRLLNEVCLNKFCKLSERRTSLVSATSGNMRLSRTDSRIAYITPEVTIFTVDERLKKSLDSLEDQINEDKHTINGNQQRRQTISGVMLPRSSLVFLNRSHRQSTSCTHIETLRDESSDTFDSGIHSISFTEDFASTSNVDGQNEVSMCELNELEVELSSQSEDNNSHVYESVSTSQICDYNYLQITNKQQPSCPYISSTPLQLSFLNLQPQLSPSSVSSSSLNSHFSSFSVCHAVESKNQISSPNSTISPINDSLAPKSLMYTDSHLKEATQHAMRSNDRHCLESLCDSKPHPYLHKPSHQTTDSTLSNQLGTLSHDQSFITHTSSCPILEAITSEKMFSSEICIESKTSHLRKVASALLDNRLDFVSLVNREVDRSRRDRYLV